MLDYCKFLTSSTDLARAWVNGDFSHTSVANFGELYEQIFDDLDSDAFEKKLEIHLAKNIEVRDALHLFLASLKCVDKSIEERPELSQPRKLFQSIEWIELTKSAHNVICKAESKC